MENVAIAVEERFHQPARLRRDQRTGQPGFGSSEKTKGIALVAVERAPRQLEVQACAHLRIE